MKTQAAGTLALLFAGIAPLLAQTAAKTTAADAGLTERMDAAIAEDRIVGTVVLVVRGLLSAKGRQDRSRRWVPPTTACSAGLNASLERT